MSTIIQAPFPNVKVTVTAPDARFTDGRASESTIQIKRSMLGRVITYVNPSTNQTLILPLEVTKMKALEIEAFAKVYQSAHWKITLFDGSVWDVQLRGEPVSQTSVGRLGDNPTPGKEIISMTLTFSGKKIS